MLWKVRLGGGRQPEDEWRNLRATPERWRKAPGKPDGERKLSGKLPESERKVSGSFGPASRLRFHELLPREAHLSRDTIEDFPLDLATTSE
jgi:hypothetical protein